MTSPGVSMAASYNYTNYRGRRSRVAPRNPLMDWWIPMTPAQSVRNDERQQDLDLFYELAKTCIEDKIDKAAFETLLIANCSLRQAAKMTGFAKTTLARRRDQLLARMATVCTQDHDFIERLLD